MTKSIFDRFKAAIDLDRSLGSMDNLELRPERLAANRNSMTFLTLAQPFSPSEVSSKIGRYLKANSSCLFGLADAPTR